MLPAIAAIVIVATVPDASITSVSVLLRAAAREAGCPAPVVSMRSLWAESKVEITVECPERPEEKVLDKP